MARAPVWPGMLVGAGLRRQSRRSGPIAPQEAVVLILDQVARRPSADGRKLETAVEEMRLGRFGGHDADIARLGDQVAAAAARLVRTLIALLQTEGATLISNPIDHGDDS